MNNKFKVRIEDSVNGEVYEYSSDCVSVISITDDGDGSFSAKIRALRDCSYAATGALVQALGGHKEETERQIFGHFFNFKTEEIGGAHEPKGDDE